MVEIGFFAIVLALGVSVYSGLSIIFGLATRRGEMIQNTEKEDDGGSYPC